MTPTPEIEARGLKAYEQVCAFERLRSWRMPAGYSIIALIPVLAGSLEWQIGHQSLAFVSFVVAVGFAIGTWMHWRNLSGKYRENLDLLAELEKTYGDNLPWVQVEKHFAALDQLKKELAAERPNGQGEGGEG